LRDRVPSTLPAGERPGDPGVVLRGVGREPRLAGCVGVVALTDGGDEAFVLDQPPGVPLSIIGIGPGPGDKPDNLALGTVEIPAAVEVNLAATLRVEVAATWTSAAFRAGLAAVPLALDEWRDGAWGEVASQAVALGNGRAQMAFTRTWAQAGSVRLRLRVAALPGEASQLDNQQETVVEVREQSLHVLYFTRELGLDFKTLRQELARDGGLTFTALFRTLASRSAGDRSTLQGDRIAGDEALAQGFPSDPAGLRRYGVIVVGSFAASAWTAAEQAALAAYVEQGGAAVFLGGERSFGAGGYAGSALAPLLVAEPGADALARGVFPVTVPVAAHGHPAVAGLAEALGTSAAVESLNRLGPLRPGATVLLVAADDGRAAPLVAVMPYGRGRVACIASNTLDRLGRGSPAFGRFWRQFVRHLAATGDQGTLVRVEWDRERYRPGDTAMATIIPTAGDDLRMAATLTAPDGTTAPLTLEPAPESGVPGARRARLHLEARGAWGFRLSAEREQRPAETMQRTLLVTPALGEGARLSVDHAMLARVASAGGGTYAPEAEAEHVLAALSTTLAGSTVPSETPLAGGWWYPAALLGLLTWGWWARRRRHLT
jgi:uncharacterized membrane protein